MRLSAIALKIRVAETRFGTNVGGAVELAQILDRDTIKSDVAFVIPLGEDAAQNTSNVVMQTMIERFGVVVVIKNDTTQRDKQGIRAYDEVHDIRNEIFGAIMNLDLGFESVISYRGGSLIRLTPAYLWYQFEFDYTSQIVTDSETGRGVIPERTNISDRKPDAFNTIYTQFVLNPSIKQREIDEDPHLDIPVVAGLVDMTTIIDLTDDPRQGGFTDGFATAFDFYDEDRR